jgi:Skp family chaperone for outer membrane proteins
MKRHVRILGLSMIVVFVAASLCVAQEPRVGCVNIMHFMQKSVQAKESQRKLQALKDQKKNALDRKVDEIRALKEKLEKQGPMLKEETRNGMIRDASIKETELKLAQQEAESSLQSAFRDWEQTTQQELTKIVSQIRTEKKLSYVVRSEALLAYDPAMDITDEVISRYDASHPGTPPKPAPRPAPVKPKR